jgi:hypothetical protein
MQELLTEINWGIIIPLLVINMILIIIGLIDWARTDETNGPKWLWLLVILFVSMLGPVLYFVIGRRQQ